MPNVGVIISFGKQQLDTMKKKDIEIIFEKAYLPNEKCSKALCLEGDVSPGERFAVVEQGSSSIDSFSDPHTLLSFPDNAYQDELVFGLPRSSGGALGSNRSAIFLPQ